MTDTPRNRDRIAREGADTGEERREADIQRDQKSAERARREAEERAAGDAFDRDLEFDNVRERGLAAPPTSLSAELGGTAGSQPHAPPGEEHRQHARKGQAQSPRELTHNEPPRKKEGHR